MGCPEPIIIYAHLIRWVTRAKANITLNNILLVCLVRSSQLFFFFSSPISVASCFSSFLFIHSYIRPISTRYFSVFFLSLQSTIILFFFSCVCVHIWTIRKGKTKRNETKRNRKKRNQEKREHRTGHDKPSILFHHHYHQFILFVVLCISRIWIPWVCFIVTACWCCWCCDFVK